LIGIQPITLRLNGQTIRGIDTYPKKSFGDSKSHWMKRSIEMARMISTRRFVGSGLIVLIAVTTGMRMSEILGLVWSDVMYNEGLLAVRAKLKGGKMRYVPMPPELADELRRFMPQPANNVLYIAGNNHERIFPPKKDAKGERQRVEGSFDDLLERAGIKNFRFHDLRHTFASWYMMNGGDLYELAKILGHSNIKMTERYAKLAKHHIARTSNTAREMWKLLEPIGKKAAAG
jgi:integrase